MLDQNTINKIAAGEVVERPASVVKELVENAIDAKASAITVEIKGGGLELIRITDNGMGIEKTDIRSAFLRHSTSKIQHIEDLTYVASLGFRGEALASIAAVASVELLTKTSNTVVGTRYLIEGGKEVAFSDVGCPEGTTIIINQLFYNTPVRKKFLKSPSTEGSYVAELMNKLALGNPEISFKFILNGSVKLHTSGNNNLKDVIFNVYGKEAAKKMVIIDQELENMTITGFLGKPELARANRNYENYFINGRYIKSSIIQKAIEDAFSPKLILHRFPFVVLHMTINGDNVDVNVHPTKMDVRFNDEKDIYNQVYSAINNTLSHEELIPEVTFGSPPREEKPVYNRFSPEPFEVNRKAEDSNEVDKDRVDKDSISHAQNRASTFGEETAEYMSKSENNDVTTAYKKPLNDVTESYIKQQEINTEQLEIDSHFIEKQTIKSHKIIGQLFKTYWIVEFKDKYYLIDQHAAHERVLYEQLIHQLESHHINSQVLLEPVVVHVSIEELERFKTYQLLFQTLGYDAEVFGNDALIIRSVPYIFNKAIDSKEFLVMLDQLSDQYKESQSELLLDEMASMSCKAAVKANDTMSDSECHRLIEELLTLENPFNCPHGRPTIIAMTKYELEKKFKRIV